MPLNSKGPSTWREVGEGAREEQGHIGQTLLGLSKSTGCYSE